MIVYIQRLGGLGNQLFQVANGIAYSKKYNTSIIISDKTDPKRKSYNDTVFNQFLKYSHIPRDTYIYKEPMFNFLELPKNNNLILSGYFQSPKYFDMYRDTIINTLIYPTKVYIPINTICIAVHIRRSDYIGLENFHPMPSLQYYQRGISEIQYKIGTNTKIVVFSDDIPWCKNQSLFNNTDVIFMEGTTELEDLYNMSLCNHFVIANSSFSWWGSYLSKNVNKIIIAPKRWFGPKGPSNWSDIYLRGTIVI